jgi:hypothetical protein
MAAPSAGARAANLAKHQAQNQTFNAPEEAQRVRGETVPKSSVSDEVFDLREVFDPRIEGERIRDASGRAKNTGLV